MLRSVKKSESVCVCVCVFISFFFILLVLFSANMSFDLDSYLDDLDTVPTSKEKAGTYTAPYSPSRMGLTIIPTVDNAEVSLS